MQRTGAPHVDDGELVRQIDGEAPAAVGAHIASCQPCSTRLQEMRERLARLSDLLRDIDVVTPPIAAPDAAALRLIRAERWVSRLWQAAAAVVLVAGLAVSPLGAWVAAQVGRLGAALTSDGDGRRAASPEVPSEPGPTVVYFEPVGAELTVRLAARPSAGSFRVDRDDRASAQIVRAHAGESLVVLPSELRIRNTPASRADYLITVPASVHSVRVQVEGEPSSRDVILDLSASPRHTISLGAAP
jgi:hypothetical protein